jgi:conjugal transfer pilus assembly protein TraV
MPSTLKPIMTQRRARRRAALLLPAALATLSSCSAMGSLMSPYSEKFSCKNPDHGQCIHPDKAYADAVAGVPHAPIRRSAMTERCSRVGARVMAARFNPVQRATKGTGPYSPIATASTASFKA